MASAASPKKDLHEVKSRIRQMQKDVSQTEGSRQKALEQLTRTEQEITATTRHLHLLERQQSALQAELGGLHQQVEVTRGGIRQQQQALGEWVQQRYFRAVGDPLPWSLIAQSPEEMERQSYYLGSLSQYQAQKITALTNNLQTLDVVTQQRESKSRQLAGIEGEMVRQQQHLEQENAARTQLVAELSGRLESQRKSLESLRHDEARLTQLLERLTRQAASSAARPRKKHGLAPPASGTANGQSLASIDQVPEAGQDDSNFSRLRGHLRLPLRGELKTHFGTPRADTGLTWRGIFIHAPEGHEVHAVASGKVVYADWLRGFGNLLIIDHGGGYMSLYGGGQSLFSHVGDVVQTGAVVASAGNTGGNDESGLYFELRFQGRPFDPMRWVGNP